MNRSLAILSFLIIILLLIVTSATEGRWDDTSILILNLTAHFLCVLGIFSYCAFAAIHSTQYVTSPLERTKWLFFTVFLNVFGSCYYYCTTYQEFRKEGRGGLMRDPRPAFFLFKAHLSLFWKAYVAGLVMATLLVGSMFLAIGQMDKSRDMLQWPTTKARIVQSSVRDAIGSANFSNFTTCSADLMLRYEAQGSTWQTSYQRTWHLSARSPDYRSLLAQGREIEIHYSPENPKIISLLPLVPEGP